MNHAKTEGPCSFSPPPWLGSGPEETVYNNLAAPDVEAWASCQRVFSAQPRWVLVCVCVCVFVFLGGGTLFLGWHIYPLVVIDPSWVGSNQTNTDAPILEAPAIFRLCLWLGAFFRLASQKIPMCRGLPFIEPYLSANFIRELLVNGAKRHKASIHGTLPPMKMGTGQNENHQKTAV